MTTVVRGMFGLFFGLGFLLTLELVISWLETPAQPREEPYQGSNLLRPK
jgi:hypothetical protein